MDRAINSAKAKDRGDERDGQRIANGEFSERKSFAVVHGMAAA
jgi:hypothetical protein